MSQRHRLDLAELRHGVNLVGCFVPKADVTYPDYAKDKRQHLCVQ